MLLRCERVRRRFLVFLLLLLLLSCLPSYSVAFFDSNFPRDGATHHAAEQYIQVSPGPRCLEYANNAARAGGGDVRICFVLARTDDSSRRAVQCVPVEQVAVSASGIDKYVKFHNNLGEGNMSFDIRMTTLERAVAWQASGYQGPAGMPIPVSPSCMATGTYVLSMSCSRRIGDRAGPFSMMTNDLVMTPLDHALCYEEWPKSPLPLPPVYRLLGVLSAHRSTFGAPYGLSAFGHGDKLFLEFVLQRYPGFKKMVEFGTWTGITSMYVGLAAAMRGGTLTTFDLADQRTEDVKRVWLDGVMRMEFADLENPDAVAGNARRALQTADFWFNDGGDKDLEAELYARFLPIGAGVLAHDFSYDHARPQRGHLLEDFGFTPMYEDVGIHLNSCARFWVRTGLGKRGKAGDVLLLAEDVAQVDAAVRGDTSPRSEAGAAAAGTRVVQGEEASFIQFAYIYTEGRELLAKWRQHQEKEAVAAATAAAQGEHAGATKKEL